MEKPKSFRPWYRFQTFLMPPSPKDWLPADHLVFFLLDLPNKMDFEAIVGPCRLKDAAFRVLTGNQQPDHSRYRYAEDWRLQRVPPPQPQGTESLVCGGPQALPEGGGGDGVGGHSSASSR